MVPAAGFSISSFASGEVVPIPKLPPLNQESPAVSKRTLLPALSCFLDLTIPVTSTLTLSTTVVVDVLTVRVDVKLGTL